MLIEFVKDLASAWDRDKPARLAAGLAYYGMFSLAPILYVIIAVAGLFIDKVLLTEQLYSRINQLLGPETAQFIADMVNVAAVGASAGTTIGTIVGVLALIFAATGLFANLKYSMNNIWNVPASEYAGLWAFVKTRLIAFLIVIGLGGVLVIGALFSILVNWLSGYLPIASEIGLLNYLPILGITFITLIIFYRILPDTHVGWGDVWLAALVITFVYALVAWVIGSLLGALDLRSALEAAGAVALVLMAIYYAAQIFLLGAEFSKVYAYRAGSRRDHPAGNPENNDLVIQ